MMAETPDSVLRDSVLTSAQSANLNNPTGSRVGIHLHSSAIHPLMAAAPGGLCSS